jgi:tryptophan synthase alpha chain
MEIEEKFRELKVKGEGAYMPHAYYGDPNEEFSLELIKTLVENGADFIEFGIPFSDPIADGPTFIAACERALEGGTTPASCIEGVRRLREMDVKVPIILTTYFNIPYVMGIENFMERVSGAGVQGLIVPDLPVEESAEFLESARAFGLRVIFQVAPTTSDERLGKIIEAASGFIYVINVEGVTGARESLLQSTLELVKKVRGRTDTPLMAGFGISKGEHARAMVSAGADGVITGSAITKIYARNLTSPEKTLPDVARFAREIKQACVEGFRNRA